MPAVKPVTYTVGIVEDDADTRGRLAKTVQADASLRLVGQAGTCVQGRELLRKIPQVLLVDLGLPDGDGTELIREAAAAGCAHIMVITVFGDEQHVVQAIEAGATGYLLKDASPRETVRAIHDLVEGGAPISPGVARHLLARLAPARPPQPVVETSLLTERELEILRLVAKGLAYAEIGALVAVSVNTVAFHVKQIYRKLAVHSRGEAVFEAMGRGLIPHGGPTGG